MSTEQSTNKPTAPEPPSSSAEKDMETEELTLESGQKITIGRPKGSAAAKEAQIQAAKKKDDDDNVEVMESHGPGFTLPVNWPAGSSGYTDSGFQSRTGISQWGIDVGGVYFQYRVWFVTDQTYDYQFQDRSNQWYECNVWLAGSHYIDYNSDMPDIQAVSGS